ncbi:hypothetical protein BX659_11631 [Orenia metallireducens]|uniref:hypothetical protein n=1 Tax=Orenia metallireducens TaxID=1413210 RepID=UPI000D05F474|nr:hypothetical protein [Orenia metallireducens]PRX27442.1 hypothetical protein BX659_11631 [Orenia metallireducens]
MEKIFLFLLLILVLINISMTAFAASIFDWKTYETDDFIVFYQEGYEYQAEQTLYYLEKYHSKIDSVTGNDKNFKTCIVLQDMGLEVDGEADPLPVKISIVTNNPQMGPLLSYDSWLRMVSVHEYTHISQMTNTKGTASVLTKIFGNFFSPNRHSPIWVLEGITVYNESQTSPYEGRLNAGYFDTLISSKAAADKLPSLLEANYRLDYFPKGQFYLYGGVFFRYLAETYGEDKFTEFFNEYGSYYWTPILALGDVFPAIGIDKAAKKIYGKRFPDLFEEWKSYEKEKNKGWQIPGKVIASSKSGSIKGLTFADNKLYYFKEKTTKPAVLNNRSVYNLIEYDLENKGESILLTSLMPNVASIKVVNNKLYYAIGVGETAILYSYDLKTARKEEILEDEFNDYSVLENGTIIYARQNNEKFGSEIWKYANGDEKKLGITEEFIGEIESYQDRLIVVSKEVLGSNGIKFLDINDVSLEEIIDTQYPETNINVIADKIYFISNYDGLLTNYEYNLETKKLAKITDGILECKGIKGLSYKDKFYFVSVDAEGTNIYEVPLNYEEVSLAEEKVIEDNIKLDLSDLDIQAKEGKGFSKSLSHLFKPTKRLFPSLLAGEDALGLNSYSIDYSEYGGLDFYFNTQMLLVPISISSIKQDDDEDEDRETCLNLLLPVYSKGTELRTDIMLDYNTNFSENVIPGVAFNLATAKNNLSFYLQNNVNNNGVNSEVSYSYLMDNSSIVLKGSKFKDFEKDDNIRGFSFDDIDNGYQLNAEYIHKLFEVRDGLWNPNVFIGDIYGSIFVDYFNDDDLDVDEAGMANYLYIIPVVGISMTDDETKVYSGVKMEF